MSSFEELKATLKDKWLSYYEHNRSWLKEMLENTKSWVEVSDDGYRPSSHLIIGAISVLEPNLRDWLIPFCELNSEEDSIIKVLGLDFDPEKELAKRTKEASNLQNYQSDPYLEEIRQQNQN
ncbi:conserved hypothetical protein [Gloeothece citriformis PCC 7424]|uniref:DUF5331 domain-containing protein n=1 Tax=Gloeothece citriformis (strain PCC 7424) TaxID=65393 RepID=B7KIV9_GLOC7|nr:DUF5331 domain-containing protein [Gloeothece citriformis]ACK70795.1 conserved hypothetical protein [Gloeothece citriformis PCC 7424]